MVVDDALGRRESEAHHAAAVHLRLQPVRMQHGAAIGDAEIFLDLELRRFRCRARSCRSRRPAPASCPRFGSLSLATPIRPEPASAVTDALVSGLMSVGISLPEYLPPSSIAFLAASAKLIDLDASVLWTTFSSFEVVVVGGAAH